MSIRQVGRFTLVAPLGKGGAGEVFQAVAPNGAPVALKLMRRVVAQERFVRECRVQSELAREGGFVPVLDAGLSPLGAYIVMPLVPAGTLRDRLRRGPLAVPDALRVGRALAGALGRAHARGFVHRDIKPENVLFDADGRPLIADMGLGKHVDGDAHLGLSRSLSATGDVRGTIGYLAPECVRDSKHADQRADVFSLGAVLYECLTGKAAFEANTLLEVLASVATGKFTPIRALRPDAPEALAAAIERCLDGVPERRYADAGALERALRTALARGRTRPVTPRRRAALVAVVLAVPVAGGLALAWRASRAAAAAAEEADAAAAVASLIAVNEARSAAIQGAMHAIALKQQRRVLEAEEQFERVADIESDDPAVLFLRAMARSQQGDPAGARADLDRVLAHEDLEPAVRGRAYSARAVARRSLGDREGALADLRLATADLPDDAIARAELAATLLELKRFDEAHEAATQALARDPRHAGALLCRATVYAARGDFTRALADSQAALQANPDLREARLYRGISRLVLGEPAGAEQDLSVYLDHDPLQRDARVARADARMRLGEVSLAISDYDVALSAADDPQTRLKRAEALARYGHAEKSDADYEAAAAAPELLERALTERAGHRAARGDLAGALADADRLAAIAPRNPGPHLLRAALLHRQGDEPGAVAAAETGLRLAEPGSASAKAARSLLDRLGAKPPP